jgi:hypothetical protein
MAILLAAMLKKQIVTEYKEKHEVREALEKIFTLVT